MTAVAPPLSASFHSDRWNSTGGNELGSANSEERTFAPGPRKTAQRQNSSSSIASTDSASSTSTTIATSPAAANGSTLPPTPNGDNWATRKKPSRGLWPPGKAEAATGLSIARPQPVNSLTSGPTASSAISALHGPLPPAPQMTNGAVAANGRVAALPAAILTLLPMNATFERKIITVPYQPDVLRIGRQTNQKTLPTPHNGFFDSKVLSRQHAEVYADLQGRIFIRDVKSSNGTFVNGMRLSQENKESEPRELREQDVLELGIDIVSEDQKTVVHHKVAAKVEHAGVYQPGNDPLNFADLDPSTGPAPLVGQHQLRRNGSQGTINVRANGNGAVGHGPLAPQVMPSSQLPKWLNPVTPEQIVRKLNIEQRQIEQQSAELRRARELIEKILSGNVEPLPMETKPMGSDRKKFSPIKGKMDLKSQFYDPPAPPPQAPLPEKPDVARALADPVILPLLRRDTTKPPTLASANVSPTRTDHSGDILRLCEELKSAKGELTTQSERLKTLESALVQERSARESAEERAERLEQRRDSPTDEEFVSPRSSTTADELQAQLERLRATMDEMKLQMERYRTRAEAAESDRDDARQTLAEMIEEKRRENARLVAEEAETMSTSSVHSEASASTSAKSRPGSSSSSNGKRGSMNSGSAVTTAPSSVSGDEHLLEAFAQKFKFAAEHDAISPSSGSPATISTTLTPAMLLLRAGLFAPAFEDAQKPLTLEQARVLTDALAREVFGEASAEALLKHIEADESSGRLIAKDKTGVSAAVTHAPPTSVHSHLAYYGVPYGSLVAVVLLGVVAMTWVDRFTGGKAGGVLEH